MKKIPFAGKANLLFREDAVFTELNKKINTGYKIQALPMNHQDKIDLDLLPEDAIPLLIRKKNAIQLITLRSEIMVDEGDR